MSIVFTTLASPIGSLFLIRSPRGLAGLTTEAHIGSHAPDRSWREAPELFGEETRQLAEYFAGERLRFDLTLAPEGTPFMQRVWAALRETIPFGATRSYGELAHALGRPGAARAVGAANARNPISIVVPCHRVIGASGQLVGYGGGLERKRWLLEHEQRVIARLDATSPKKKGDQPERSDGVGRRGPMPPAWGRGRRCGAPKAADSGGGPHLDSLQMGGGA